MLLYVSSAAASAVLETDFHGSKWVSSCLMFVCLVPLVLFPIMYVSLCSYIWIPE